MGQTEKQPTPPPLLPWPPWPMPPAPALDRAVRDVLRHVEQKRRAATAPREHGRFSAVARPKR